MSRFQSGELNAQQSTIGLNHHVVDEDDDVDDDIDGDDVDDDIEDDDVDDDDWLFGQRVGDDPARNQWWPSSWHVLPTTHQEVNVFIHITSPTNVYVGCSR